MQEESLPAGIYFVGLSQAYNESNGDMNTGFGQDGAPNRNFTNVGNFCGAGTVYFCDPFADFTPDTANWTVNFAAAEGTVTELGQAPEPASVFGLLGGLGLLSLMARSRR